MSGGGNKMSVGGVCGRRKKGIGWGGKGGAQINQKRCGERGGANKAKAGREKWGRQ